MAQGYGRGTKLGEERTETRILAIMAVPRRCPDETHLPNGVISDYEYDDLNRLELLRQFRDDDADDIYTAGVDALLAEYDYDLRATVAAAA